MKLYYVLHLIVLIAFYNFQTSAQETPLKTKAEKELEKLKTLNKSFTLSLQYGHYGLSQFAKADDNISGININDYHGKFNLLLEYYPYEEIAAQLSIGLIIIPQVQNIDSITFDEEEGIRAKGSGKGGAIIPVTIGIKKTFLDGLVRPYVSLLAGFTIIKLGTGTGTGSINGIEKDIDYESAQIFSYQLGTGFQYRLGKVVRIDVGLGAGYHNAI